MAVAVVIMMWIPIMELPSSERLVLKHLKLITSSSRSPFIEISAVAMALLLAVLAFHFVCAGSEELVQITL